MAQHEQDSATSEAGGQGQPGLLARLRRSGAAAAGAVSGAVSTVKDASDSMRYNAHKAAVRMDKWAAEGVVSAPPAVRLTHAAGESRR